LNEPLELPFLEQIEQMERQRLQVYLCNTNWEDIIVHYESRLVQNTLEPSFLHTISGEVMQTGLLSAILHDKYAYAEFETKNISTIMPHVDKAITVIKARTAVWFIVYKIQ
jgi:hypothetical protein